MNGHQYLENIINKYSVNLYNAEYLRMFFKPFINNWANGNLVDLTLSGSISKGTAVSNGTDVDLFISLSSSTKDSLSDIYNSLFVAMQKNGFYVRKQNVSIGINYSNYQIDLVPAKRQDQYGNDHSLYLNKKGSWTKTNINKHIYEVKNSGRVNEIKLIKIWRNIYHLDFPSFYLEMLVIDALKNHRINDLPNNFISVLSYISNNIEVNSYIDPANTNNCISDQISMQTKKQIASQATDSLSKKIWEDIIL
ncbi:hypothetical protein [Providencia hangzhouensis]|uniref:hypothetical protein n=1 Tax=Providencia hangzhouensis TaxID=3031799 RepID=UPI0034DD6888